MVFNMKTPMITHKHLKTVIEDIYLNDNRLTEELLAKLINELRYSNLIIPAKRENQTLNFIIYEFEGKKFSPLFTDLDEFHKFFKDEDLRILDNSFELYHNVVKTRDIDGYILNPASENYIIERDFILSINHFPKDYFDDRNSYTPRELRRIYENIDNRSLNEFISERNSIGDYQGLFEEFSKSTLLTLMLSTKDIPDKDGIIDLIAHPQAFMHVDRVGGEYLTIYSDRSKLSDVNIDPKLYRYAQIVNLYTLVSYILSEDLDGLILNPDSDSILIPRGELLKNSLGFERFCNDPKLSRAILFIFPPDG